MSETAEELRQKRLARLQTSEPSVAKLENADAESKSSKMEVTDAPQKIPRTTIPELKPESPKPMEIIEKASSMKRQIDPLETLYITMSVVFEIDPVHLKNTGCQIDLTDDNSVKNVAQLLIFERIFSQSKQGHDFSENFLEVCDPLYRRDAEYLYYLACCYTRCLESNFAVESHKQCLLSTILNSSLLLISGALTSTPFNSLSFFFLLREKLIGANFLTDLLSQTNDPKFVDRICHPILQRLSTLAIDANLSNQSYRSPVEMLAELCGLKNPANNARPFCSSLVRLENFLPPPFTKDHGDEIKATPGREFQLFSYLGPFFAFSTFSEDDMVVLHDCYAVDDPSNAQLSMTNQGLAQNAENLRRHLHEIVHCILVNSESRSPMLNYIAAVLERSWKRRQHYFDYRQVGSDGFILNWLYVLQKLSAKIKVDKVAKEYLWHPKCRIGHLVKNDDARVRFNKQEYEQFLAERPKTVEDNQDPTFSTECFYATAFIHHIGIVSIIRRFNNRNRAVHEIKSTIEKLEKKQLEAGNLNKEETRQLKFAKLELSAVKRMGHSVYGALSDPCLIDQTVQFLNTFCAFLLSYVFPDLKNIPNQFGSTKPSDLPPMFRALPEFFFENIAEWLFYYARVHPIELSQAYVDDIITWFTLFLSNTSIIKNPFLTARLVETLFMLCPLNPRHPTERLFTTVVMAPIARNGLVPSLMKFYVDCELTGSHTEFFDKFNIRYHISVIFKQIWNLIEYKTAIIQEAQTAVTNGAQSVFVKFVNMLINDCTFFLDESMQCLKRIHEIQQLQANEAEWGRLSDEAKKAKLEVMAQDERQVPQYLNLAEDNLRMFEYLTKDAKEAFMVPEIVDKLAAMLNYNLAQICGPRCIELKVQNPEKYHWNPKGLLERLVMVYLGLDCDRFANAIAGDERSYNSDLFPRAYSRVQKTGILPGGEAEKFRALGEKVKSISDERMQEEIDLGEPPEHFKDALMDTLMTDPVKLPSGNVCDRTIVTRLLLDRPADPFNRQEMTENDLVPLPELKAEIEDWIKSRKAELAQNRK